MRAETQHRTTVVLTTTFVGALIVVPAAFLMRTNPDEPSGDRLPPPPLRATSTATATATLPPTPTVDAPGAAEFDTGNVRANDAAADLRGPLAFGTDQSRAGAVAAFTSTATWLLASPAARNEPTLAVTGPTGSKLNVADAQGLIGMVRSPEDDFTPSRGVYRILGHSGDAASPDQVMVEVAAPARFGDNTRWLIIGGVVTWSEGRWNLASIAPQEVPQPPPTISHARQMSPSQQSQTFPGLGWQYFAAEG